MLTEYRTGHPAQPVHLRSELLLCMIPPYILGFSVLSDLPVSVSYVYTGIIYKYVPVAPVD